MKLRQGLGRQLSHGESKIKPSMVVNDCNPSAGEMEARLVDTTLLAKFEASESL